jgi:hypothetical protein
MSCRWWWEATTSSSRRAAIGGHSRQCSHRLSYRCPGQIHRVLELPSVLEEADARWCWRRLWWSCRRPGQIHRVLQRVGYQKEREQEKRRGERRDGGTCNWWRMTWAVARFYRNSTTSLSNASCSSRSHHACSWRDEGFFGERETEGGDVLFLLERD